MSSRSSCTNTDRSLRGMDTSIFTQATCVAQTLVTLWHTPVTYLSGQIDMPCACFLDPLLETSTLNWVTSCVSDRPLVCQTGLVRVRALLLSPLVRHTNLPTLCVLMHTRAVARWSRLLLLLVQLLLVLLLLLVAGVGVGVALAHVLLYLLVLLYLNLNKPCFTRQH